jgi:hypothetical protein
MLGLSFDLKNIGLHFCLFNQEGVEGYAVISLLLSLFHRIGRGGTLFIYEDMWACRSMSLDAG